MTLVQLEYAVALATYKSFIAAAEKCYVTQPTLSLQIQKLEDELGVKIFDRAKHPVEVTGMGRLIIDQIKKTLEEFEKIHELIQQQQEVISGTFRLAVIPTVAPNLLPPLLENYAKNFPDIRLQVLEMETNRIITALKNNEVDAGLLSTPLEDKDIKEYPLFYEPFVVYLQNGDPLLEKRLVEASDIELEKIWLLNEGHCMRNQVIDLCSDNVKRLQAKKPYKYESSNVETLRRLVDKTGGITILPELSIYYFDEDRIEKVRYFTEPEPVREISLVTNSHFVHFTMLQSIMDEVLNLIPEKMRVQKKNRKVLRIQSARLD